MAASNTVRIAGLGVSGSALAMFLAERGFQVEAYDPSGFYSKPCGDAVSVRPWISRLLYDLDTVITGVRRYTIMINGRKIASVEYSSDNWLIIDKHRLVHSMRRQAEKLGVRLIRGNASPPCGCTRGCFCVDARGPYAHKRSTWILTVRHILEARDRWNPEEALIDFLPEMGGLYWAFPASDDGRLVNAGAGWMGGRFESSRKLSLERSKQVLGSFEVIDEKAAPIAVFSPIRLASKGSFAVGEAAGLVMSTSGEGNRPGLESARALAESLESSEDLDEAAQYYTEKVKPLVSEARASRIGLGIALRFPGLFKRVARGLPVEFWRDYLSSRLTLEKASLYMFMLPVYL